jgi:hypothetical protein
MKNGLRKIKKVEDWTFSEHQTHAKGVLEGMLIGSLLTINVVIWYFICLKIF